MKDICEKSVEFCDTLEQIIKRKEKNQKCLEELLRSGFVLDFTQKRPLYIFTLLKRKL